ncbi:MAG: 16S rRNA (adenine(1518)-N(6)/adenine(1519)-N(6))-dimethyltransferase RsmA [Desulfomonilaceae bacterium]
MWESKNGYSMAMIRNKIHPKAIFRAKGLAPKKWLGQNLLVDPSYLDMIVDVADLREGDHIIEIGAGLGALTKELARLNVTVWAIEVDAGFFRELELNLSSFPNVKLIHQDVLRFDFRSLAADVGKLKVVANLPYSLSSRIIFTFQENHDIFDFAVVMLQREVAERLVADPGTRDYGALTVLLAATAYSQSLFDVPPEAFYPRPAVTSTMIRIVFPDTPPHNITDHKFFTILVKAAFSSRRKTLRNSLKSLVAHGLPFDRIIEAAGVSGVDLGRRAETLSPEEFVRFSNTFSEMALRYSK